MTKIDICNPLILSTIKYKDYMQVICTPISQIHTVCYVVWILTLHALQRHNMAPFQWLGRPLGTTFLQTHMLL